MRDHAAHQNHGDHAEAEHHGSSRHGVFRPSLIDQLLSEERHASLPPEQTLRTLGVASGQSVVDLGCGPGYFTLPSAELVGPRGRVYGVDTQPEMVEACRRRAAEAGMHNVEVHLSSTTQVPLPDSIADVVLISAVLHEAEDRTALLREARRLLAPGGAVALIELREEVGPPGSPRISAAEIGVVAGAVGLRVRQQQDLDDQNVLFRLEQQPAQAVG